MIEISVFYMETKDFGDYNSISELLDALSPYISARALARICDMSESQMLQYKGGFKQPGPKVITRINDALHSFGKELLQYRLKID